MLLYARDLLLGTSDMSIYMHQLSFSNEILFWLIYPYIRIDIMFISSINVMYNNIHNKMSMRKLVLHSTTYNNTNVVYCDVIVKNF